MPRGVWSLWNDIPEPARGELRAIYRDLRATYGPFNRAARRWAKQAAEAWRVAAAVSEEAAVLASRRQRGRGRRPKRQQVIQAAKRQALELGTLDATALPRLEAFTGRNGHGRARPGRRDGFRIQVPTTAELTEQARRELTEKRQEGPTA